MRLICLFSFLNYDINLTVASFFGMMKVGTAHSDRLTLVNMLMDTSQSR